MKACCRKYLLSHEDHTGMGSCECGTQWYHIIPGWSKKWGTDRVYHRDVFKGVMDEYGKLRKIIAGEA